jgi:Mor family transcriptional regulator
MAQSDCIASFLEIIKDTLKSVGMKSGENGEGDDAGALSALIVESLSEQHRGMNLYFPMQKAKKVKEKHDLIYEEWNAGGCKNIR